MSRIFKAKKQHRFLKWRYLLFIGIAYLSFDTTYSFLLDKKTMLENDAYIKMILADSNHHFAVGYQPKKIISGAVAFLSNIDVTKPASLLNIHVAKDGTVPVTSDDINSSDESYDPNEQEKLTDYIKDPNPSVVTKPRIYIYNSHQLENYNAKNLEIYNITPNVMMHHIC
jgi:hypothetical protein